MHAPLETRPAGPLAQGLGPVQHASADPAATLQARLCASHRVAQLQAQAKMLGRPPPAATAAPEPAGTRVVQRLVALGLDSGTQVRIVRSTSLEYHDAPATIVGPGERKNEYLVAVTATGEQVYARADQLKMAADQSRTGQPSEFDLGELAGEPPETILAALRAFVIGHLAPTQPFVIGGSFAAFLQAMAAGQPARTPRDIDVIMDKADYAGSKPRPRPDLLFCGIPLELHRSGVLVSPSGDEREAGMIGPASLLAAHMVKLRDKHFRFKEIIDKPAKPWRQAAEDERGITAERLLEVMNENNDRLMTMEDDHENFMSGDSKKVWIKTLRDVEALVGSGARAALA